jgi:OPA family glycerol-3-phosphate transporter-like MFS transporter 3/OPA family glycerol-3-phosphate transporter-like MFS transporter 1/2
VRRYLKAWLYPNVAIYALAFGCVKGVFYIFTFWLPNYLNNLQISNVALIVSMIDIGSIFGAISIWYILNVNIISHIGNRFDKRALIIIPNLWLGIVIMMIINSLKGYSNPVLGYILLSFMAGFFIGGVYNNIASAIAVELSNQPELKSNKKLTSTISSLITGYGALFTAINMLIVPLFEDNLFVYNSILVLIASILLFPVAQHEFTRPKRN